MILKTDKIFSLRNSCSQIQEISVDAKKILPFTEPWYSVRFNFILYIFNFFNLRLHAPMKGLSVRCQRTKMVVRFFVRSFLPIRFALTSHSRIRFFVAMLDSNMNFQGGSFGISSITDWTFVFLICLRMLDHMRIQFRLTHRSLNGQNKYERPP